MSFRLFSMLVLVSPVVDPAHGLPFAESTPRRAPLQFKCAPKKEKLNQTRPSFVIMPKKTSKTADSSKNTQDSKMAPSSKPTSTNTCDAVSECLSGLKISIDAKPGAKQSSIVRVEDGAVTVQIAARAVDGAANAELIDYIAEVLGVRRQGLSLVSGQLSRQKVLLLSAPCAMTPAEVLQKFLDAI